MEFKYFPAEQYKIMNRQKCYPVGSWDAENSTTFWMYGVKTGESFNDDGSYNDDVIRWMSAAELEAIGVDYE